MKIDIEVVKSNSYIDTVEVTEEEYQKFVEYKRAGCAHLILEYLLINQGFEPDYYAFDIDDETYTIGDFDISEEEE